MMLKFGRMAVVSTAVLALAAATIPSRAEADGYYRGGYGRGGYGYGGGYYAGGGCCQVYVPPPPPPPCCRVYAPPPCCVSSRAGFGHKFSIRPALQNRLSTPGRATTATIPADDTAS